MSIRLIRHVIVYAGHQQNPLLGPYSENIQKRTKMFEQLNVYRKAMHRPAWKVSQVAGERLMEHLTDPLHTLLVIPAGQSTSLDRVFSQDQLHFMRRSFFEKGGRGYLNCGSAYWASQTRIYCDVCTEQPTQRTSIIKKSLLSLFQGTAIGPICRHPSPIYQVGFFSDAVEVQSGNKSCTVLLSGGGSFIVGKKERNVSVLARYPHSELLRCGKSLKECSQLDVAAILVRIGKGAAILSMFHPYYNASDIDPERYEKAFPCSGTDWRRIVAKLSPEEERMQFALERFLIPLEDVDLTSAAEHESPCADESAAEDSG